MQHRTTTWQDQVDPFMVQSLFVLDDFTYSVISPAAIVLVST